MLRRAWLLLGAPLLLAACGSLHIAPEGGVVQASATRANPAVPPADAAALRVGDSLFAGRLMARVADRTSGNVVVSPFSITEALAMTLAGARGETAREISTALSFELGGARLHAALDALDRSLRALGGLSVANALFGQRGEAFR